MMFTPGTTMQKLHQPLWPDFFQICQNGITNSAQITGISIRVGKPIVIISSSSLRRHRTHAAGLLCLDPVLDLVAELADQALDRPGCGIAEGADRVRSEERRVGKECRL